jgi:hypothetical protein
MPQLTHLQQIAAAPSWADRQLAILEETGDPLEIVRRLTTQSRISGA